MAAARQQERVERVHDADTELLRFSCFGPTAQALYEALGPRSAAIGSEWTHEGRTYRSTNKVVRNLFGVDYCLHGGGPDYICGINLNVGEFLKP